MIFLYSFSAHVGGYMGGSFIKRSVFDEGGVEARGETIQFLNKKNWNDNTPLQTSFSFHGYIGGAVFLSQTISLQLNGYMGRDFLGKIFNPSFYGGSEVMLNIHFKDKFIVGLLGGIEKSKIHIYTIKQHDINGPSSYLAGFGGICFGYRMTRDLLLLGKCQVLYGGSQVTRLTHLKPQEEFHMTYMNTRVSLGLDWKAL